MLAAVRRTQEVKGFLVEGYPKPKIGDTDVLVRLEAAGLCGAGIQIWNSTYMGRSGPVIPPLIPGHEFVGAVEAGGLNAWSNFFSESRG